VKPRDRIETLEADIEINLSDKEGYAIGGVTWEIGSQENHRQRVVFLF
jgi:hypothetical protein